MGHKFREGPEIYFLAAKSAARLSTTERPSIIKIFEKNLFITLMSVEIYQQLRKKEKM